MATNFDKALYQAPAGLEEMEPEIEIEIEDPESVSIGIGGLEIEIEPDVPDDEFNANLAEHLPEDVLQEIAGDLIGDFDEDISSRKDGCKRMSMA
jgi:hypothetical protein